VSVAIVDYGSGNLHSAAKAFERAPFREPIVSSCLVSALLQIVGVDSMKFQG
jgi:imidazoleglycerol phosphate synthase glutamine amidotransferase subunit HisH